MDITREQAIAKLVEQDVARWGESERVAAEQLHAGLTLGRALNELANRAEMAGEPDLALRAAAKRSLTPEDRRGLRRGG